MSKNNHSDGDEKDALQKAIEDANLLVAVALIRERYGVMRRYVDEHEEYIQTAKAEKAWYKAYAAGVIGVCTLIVTGVSYMSNSQVLAKVTELVNQNRPAVIVPQATGVRH